MHTRTLRARSTPRTPAHALLRALSGCVHSIRRAGPDALRWSLSVLAALAFLAGLEHVARTRTDGAPAGLRPLTLQRVALAPPAPGLPAPVATVPALPSPSPAPAKQAAQSTAATVPVLTTHEPPRPAPEASRAPAADTALTALAPAPALQASSPVTARAAPPADPATAEPARASGAPSSRPAAPLVETASAHAASLAPPRLVETPRLVAVRELDAGFRLAAPVQPRYPEAAQRLRRAGRVQVELEVAPDGRVTGVDVQDDAPGWGFGVAAREAFALARFTPPTVNGEPVRVRWRKTLHFRP